MRTKLGLTVLAIWAGVHITGCTTDELTGEPKENQAPTVWLSAAPPEGTVTSYTIRLWWGGWDPDGEIAYYEYVVTDNEGGVFDPADTTSTPDDYKWKRVYGNDSLFTFTADVVADSTDFTDNRLEPEEFRRSHTFFIRAVDERGMRSERPVYRSFTSRTLSPVVDVIIPRATGVEPAQVPPVTTFKWVATDFVSNELEVQEPESIRTILVNTKFHGGRTQQTLDYIRKNPNAPEWTSWRNYQTAGDTGKVWTTPPLSIPDSYVFAIQAKDEAGAVNPVFDLARNVRFILVGSRSTGPILTVRNQFLGAIVTSSPNTPLSILDIPAGVEMEFEWEADASSYGGIVSGYRYGWDILDLNDPEQWAISYTPFIGRVAKSPIRTFFFGSHTFHIEVIDNSGFTSRVGVRVNVVPFTMGRNILFVDDWVENNDSGWDRTVPPGILPSDGEHDAFWESILSNVEGFSADIDMSHIEPGNQQVPIEVLADYRSVVWSSAGTHTSESPAFLNDVIRFIDPTRPSPGGKQTPNLAALFMAAGGHLLIAGDRVMTMVVNRTSFGINAPVFPMIFRYELAGDQDGSYTTDGNDVGVRGVGDASFGYNECCVNVLDVAVNTTPLTKRRPPAQQPGGQGCAVDHLRSFTSDKDGLRVAMPADSDFPKLELRPETAAPGRFYHTNGINTDLYNPPYFHNEARCAALAETDPSRARTCFEPIYTLACNDTNSVAFGSPIAFWTKVFENRIPDVGGKPARSAVFGFHPVYFKPDQVKAAIDVILFDEWGLRRAAAATRNTGGK